MTAEIQRVGPHGYIHGWIFVGVPSPGAKVFHPEHGHGQVFAHDSQYMSVHFNNGHNKQFRVGHPVRHAEHHGWSPGPNETHVNIEAAGTGGTASGAFRRTTPAASLDREGDTWHVRSATGGRDKLGEIRPSDRPGRWIAEIEDPITGALTTAYRGGDFIAAVTAILGHPPYGHSWYRVARPPGEGEVVKRRPARRAETSPGDARATERLHQYWVHGEGAAKIRWGEGGDFDRCVLHLGKYIKDPQGYCNLAHHAALGIYPATHAAEIKKETGRSTVTATTAERADKKPYGDVTYGDPKNGKYPVDTEEHARAAWSYINMPKNAGQYPMNGVTLSEVKDRIRAACKKFGIDVSDGDSGGSASRAEYMRMYQLEDIHIIRSADGGDGRTVEAYAAVFDQPAEIQDHEGHYIEVIDRSAFDTAIEFAQRQKGSFPAQVKVLYNHGLTAQGTPAPEFQVPIGIPVDIRAESRGLLTRTRYNDDPFSERVLENIRAGAITAQSFTGRIIRSDPQLRRGDRHRPDSAGQLRTVRRMKLGLREYGPVLWPAYSGAEILGVRMSTPGGVPDPDEDLDAQALPPDGEPAFAAAAPLAADEHTARYHQHALYLLRSQELREAKGLSW